MTTLLDLPLDLSTVFSLEQQVAMLSPEEQEELLSGLDTDELAYDWAWGARPQQYLDPYDESWAVTLMLAGRGCVAPWTRVYSPDDDQWIRIDQFGSRRVLTLHGPRDQLGVPFVKGTADMFTVTFSDGSAITTTAAHRFLGPEGWLRLADVHVGQLLAAGPHAPRLTGSASPSGYAVDGRCSTRTHAGCSGQQHLTAVTRWERVVSVEFSHHGQFWDLTVPDGEHYIAEGVVNHNSGKTRSSTEWIRRVDQEWANMPERHGSTGDGTLRIALLSRTAADVRDTLINGPSGLLHIYPPSLQDKVIWTPSLRKLELPYGGQVITLSAEEPDQVRGPEFHIGLADELAAHRGKPGADGLTAWDNLRIATRMGRTPQLVAATTPKRAPIMRKLIAESRDKKNRIQVRKMKTTDNPFLSDNYMAVLQALYAGTSIGTQELDGEMLDDVQGALVKLAKVDAYRLDALPPDFFDPSWSRIVGVDPSVSDKPGDECGIVVSGAKMIRETHKRHAVIVDDLSLNATPAEWARVAVRAAVKYKATVVVESNQGGAMAAMVIKNAAKELELPVPAVRQVWATGSKKTRAEPLGTAYERGRVHHLNVLPELESQLCFPAGTLITTDRGQVPIEQVTVCDRVLTREGFAPIKKSWMTGRSSTLTTVTHSTGMIVSTPWHQIWTKNRGFVPAMNVQRSDLLDVLPGLTRLSHGGGTGGDAPMTGTTGLAESFSTAPAGRRITDPSRRGCWCTTGTASTTTAQSPCNWSPLWSMLPSTLNAGSTWTSQSTALSPKTSGAAGKVRTSSVLSAVTRSAAGTCVPCTAPRNAEAGRTGGSPSLLQYNWSASPAGQTSLPSGQIGSTALLAAKTGSRPGGGVPVYDLSVADGYPHEFYADGVLVHNCEWVEGESGYSPDRMDAAVWSCMPLLFPETLKGGLPGTARSVSPNRIGSINTTRQVRVQRSHPGR